MRTTPRPGILAVLVLAALPLAACAAADAGGQGTASPSASPDAGAQGLRHAKCLREHGVKVGDPDSTGMLRIEVGDGDRATFEAAEKACKQFAPTGPVGPDGKALDPQALLPFTRCMRENGVDIPDPKQDGGGVTIGLGNGGLEPGDATFERARKACEKLLPGIGGARS